MWPYSNSRILFGTKVVCGPVFCWYCFENFSFKLVVTNRNWHFRHAEGNNFKCMFCLVYRSVSLWSFDSDLQNHLSARDSTLVSRSEEFHLVTRWIRFNPREVSLNPCEVRLNKTGKQFWVSMSFPMVGSIWPYIGYISIIIFFIFGKKIPKFK